MGGNYNLSAQGSISQLFRQQAKQFRMKTDFRLVQQRHIRQSGTLQQRGEPKKSKSAFG